jgi:hypothetical protein
VESWHSNLKKLLRLKILEARGGIEPPIMVLQTIALPLGDRAFGVKKLLVLSHQFSVEKTIQSQLNFNESWTGEGSI